MREIKFNAYLPDLEIMLDNVTLYGDGTMGYDLIHFIRELPSNYVLDQDLEVILRYYTDEGGNQDCEVFMTVLLGDNWIWFEEGQFIPLQFAEKEDINGKGIYEGDIINEGSVYWDDKYLGFFVKGNFLEGNHKPLYEIELPEIIGNIYQNPELLAENSLYCSK